MRVLDSVLLDGVAYLPGFRLCVTLSVQPAIMQHAGVFAAANNWTRHGKEAQCRHWPWA